MNSNQVTDLRVGEEVICTQSNGDTDEGDVLCVIYATNLSVTLLNSQGERITMLSVQMCTYFSKHFADNYKPWVNGKDVTTRGLIYTPTSEGHTNSTIANAAIANMILNCREEK